MVTAIPLSTPGKREVYQCDDIVVIPYAHQLHRGGHPVAVEPKAYAVLIALLEQPGTMISKATLLDIVWGHRHVTTGAVSRAISQLRHALGDSYRDPRYIATVNCLGYRFVGEVRRHETSAPALTLPLPEIMPPATSVAVERRLLRERRKLPDRRQTCERRHGSRGSAS